MNRFVVAVSLVLPALSCAAGPKRVSVIKDSTTEQASAGSRWRALDAQAQALDLQGRYAEATPLALELASMAERGFAALPPGTDPKEKNKAAILLASTLGELASLYKQQGLYTEAEPIYQRVLAILVQTLGRDDPNTAAQMNNVAELYREEARYPEAETLYLAALKVLGASPDRDEDFAIALDNIALLYKAVGEYHKAEDFALRANKIQERLTPGDSPEMAIFLANIAGIYGDQARYDEAESNFNRALALDRKYSGPSATTATVLNNIGALYGQQGRYAEQMKFYQEAIEIDERALGPRHPNVAMDRNNIGALLLAQGKNREAQTYFLTALKIDEAVFGPIHPNVARDVSNLAALYSDQGDLEAALPFSERAAAIDERTLGLKSPETAKAFNVLASLEADGGHLEKALEHARKAVSIDEAAFDKEHPSVGRDLNNVASIMLSSEQTIDVEPLLQRAVAISEKAYGPHSPLVAPLLLNLASVYSKESKYALAEPMLRRALSINEEALGPEHLDVAKVLQELARLYYRTGDYVAAQKAWARSVQILQGRVFYQSTYMSEKERLKYLETVSGVISTYLSFCFAYQAKLPSLVGEMYDLLLWKKGLVANSIGALHGRVLSSGNGKAIASLEELAALKTDLSKLRDRPPTSAEAKQWRSRVDALQGKSNALETTLTREFGTVSQAEGSARTTWKQILQALKPHEAALEFSRFSYYDSKNWVDTRYVALELDRLHHSPTLVFLGSAPALENAPLVDYRNLVKRVPEEGAGSEFYRAFWKPLEPLLLGAERVYLSPDGVLNEVAFGVVPNELGQSLIDKLDIWTVVSTRDILHSASPSGPKTAIVLGNPRFVGDASEPKGEQIQSVARGAPVGTVPAPVKQAALSASAGCVSNRLTGTLCPLEGTQHEVDAVYSQLKKANWSVDPPFTQERALKEVVTRARGPRVLHIATHGYFLPSETATAEQEEISWDEPMLHSGLVFAGPPLASSGSATLERGADNVLTAYEASGLELNGTELVVLSACQTGLGEHRDSEGVFGLRRAFQEAGSKALLMSMWSAADDTTQDLMTLFYKYWLSGMEKHRALREAQLEERKRVKAAWQGEDRRFYWGAFVLAGI